MLRIALMTMVVVFLLAPQASAQTYPYVVDRAPFSPAANYMSLPGYLRFLYMHMQIDRRPHNRHFFEEWVKEQLRQQKRPLVGPAP